MKKIFLTSLFLIAAIICCKNQETKSKNYRDFNAVERKIAESGSQFGLNVFKQINLNSQNSNLFISPIGISMVLSMALNGANGSTYTAMRNTLGFDGLTLEEINSNYQSLMNRLHGLDPKVIFEIANSIWSCHTFQFNKKFLNDNQHYYNALVSAQDFNNPNTVNIINDWVKQKTRNKITSIINQIDPEIIMILLNAIYFKGTWKYEFDKKMTHDALFRVPGGNMVSCKMMKQSGDYNYYQNDQFQCVDLPYGNGIYRMTVFLPATDNDVDNLISGMSMEKFNLWTGKMTVRCGTVYLPKFKITFERTLNDILSDLGMGIAFIPNGADFTNLDSKNGHNIYISRVRHKSFVEVTEEGTEAAAVTSVEFGVTSVGPSTDEFYFRADHPFVFCIREARSNTIMFIGKVVNPISN